MRSTLAQLDAAEKPLLKRYRTLVKHRRHVADYLGRHPRQAITLRQCDEREAVIAYITHHASMPKRNALETAIHQSMLTLLAEHIRVGMHHGVQ